MTYGIDPVPGQDAASGTGSYATQADLDALEARMDAIEAVDVGTDYTDEQIELLRNEGQAVSTLITGATYTVLGSDIWSVLQCSSGSQQTITIPPDVFDTGQAITVLRLGAGAVDFVAGSGVDIKSVAADPWAVGAQNAGVQVQCIDADTNTFWISGQLA